jgi:hypothetical protein
MFLEWAISNPSVLGLVGGELMAIWENVAPSHITMDIWDLGLFLSLNFLTMRALQEWKNNICTIKKLSSHTHNDYKIFYL